MGDQNQANPYALLAARMLAGKRGTASDIDEIANLDLPDSANVDTLRRLQQQFQDQKKAAAQSGHGDAVEMTGEGPIEPADALDQEEEDDAAQGAERSAPRAGGLLGLPVPSGPPSGSLLGSQTMLKGASHGSRPYHVRMIRTPNPKSPTGWSWAIRQVYDDGRP
jgi:hypothetical protein